MNCVSVTGVNAVTYLCHPKSGGTTHVSSDYSDCNQNKGFLSPEAIIIILFT